jgi:hypothetical protein
MDTDWALKIFSTMSTKACFQSQRRLKILAKLAKKFDIINSEKWVFLDNYRVVNGWTANEIDRPAR